MFHRKATRIALAAALAVAVAGVLSVGLLTARGRTAHASPATSITITTAIDFSGPVPQGTFVASAPLCPSGTFTDDIKVVATGQFLVEKTFTCADGSGTFTLQFHPQFVPPRDGVAGPWAVHGGMGAYTTLHGTGDFRFVPTGPGTGSETFTGEVHFD